MPVERDEVGTSGRSGHGDSRRRIHNVAAKRA